MEGEREREREHGDEKLDSRVQHEEINKSIPFLELVRPLEFSPSRPPAPPPSPPPLGELLGNVGHRRKSNRFPRLTHGEGRKRWRSDLQRKRREREKTPNFLLSNSSPSVCLFFIRSKIE